MLYIGERLNEVVLNENILRITIKLMFIMHVLTTQSFLYCNIKYPFSNVKLGYDHNKLFPTAEEENEKTTIILIV